MSALAFLVVVDLRAGRRVRAMRAAIRLTGRHFAFAAVVGALGLFLIDNHGVLLVFASLV